ncbi:hypothetical protein KXX06_004817, partial [Aspergillus fumigatus]
SHCGERIRADTPPSPPAPQHDPFLIEVNVRAPGTGGTWSTLYTYGVDLGALQLLRAVNDRDRFCALSSLFHFSGDHHPGDGGGAQYWNAICMVPVHRDWLRVPGDFLNRNMGFFGRGGSVDWVFAGAFEGQSTAFAGDVCAVWGGL